MKKPSISVIIGTYNQKESLERVLSSFNEQTTSKDSFEVIVVDSSSSDGTATLFKEFKASFQFTPIIQENKGKTAARNRAIKEAKSDLILITDADMIADPELIKTHIEAHQNTHTPSCFEGLTYNMDYLHWPPKETAIHPYIQRQIKDGKPLGWYYFLTGNLSIPKQMFMESKGFSETFKGYGWEDLELGYRLSKKKIPLYYLKKAKNYHYHVITKDEEIARNVKKGESAKQFLKLHPELKWFLGLNPLSRALFPKIKENGPLYTWIKNKCYHSPIKWKHLFGFWFLKEYHYLKGILS